MRATFAATRLLRPMLPPKYRYIAPYQEWRLQRKGLDRPSEMQAPLRRVGIKPGA